MVTFRGQIPYCYFPTKVVIVDDSQSFLDGLSLVLGGDINLEAFASPREALVYLKECSEKVEQYFSQSISIVESDTPSLTAVDVNVKQFFGNIHKDKDRFNRVSVVVVDYVMPGIDGLMFCEALKNSAYQKIVFTGEADNEFAVNAFNQKKIEQFIRKGEEDYVNKLKRCIGECQIEYFNKFSSSLQGILTFLNRGLLQAPLFIEIFNDILEKYQIAEFYLIDESGSYLLIDKKGNKIELIVKAQEDVDQFAELVDEDNGMKSIAHLIKQGKKIPRLFTWEDRLTPSERWELYDAQKLSLGHQTYYYSVVENSSASSLIA